MAKKRRIPPELKAEWMRTMRLLEERLAHHRRLDEQEQHRVRP